MAITTATIQHRRGNLDDFNPDKMVPGEFAFTTDGSRKVFAAFAPGDYKELASTEEVQGIVDEFNENIQNEIDNAVESIEQKTEESIARIPELEDKANVIEVEKTGESIIASDTSNDKFRGLTVYGKSTQETTTGKNLLENKVSNQTKSGVSITKNDNGSITLNGTSTEWFFINLNHIDTNTKSIPVGDYIVSGGYSEFVRIEIMASSAGLVHSPGGDVKFTIKASDRNSWARLTVDAGVTLSNVTLYPMIRLASITDSTYEPYTGGKASPSPQYPQDVENCENTEVSVHGKNLLENTAVSKTASGITYTINADKSITMKGGNSDSSTVAIDVNSGFSLPKGTYIVNGCKDGSTSKWRLNVYRKRDSYILAQQLVENKEFTLDEDTEVFVRIAVSSGVTVNTTVYPMIRLASITDGTYEPYKARRSLTIPYILSGIPVTDASIANYTDENGQMWVCDEVDEERQVHVQRVGKKNPVFEAIGTLSNGNKYVVFVVTDKKRLYRCCGVCTKAIFDRGNVPLTPGVFYENEPNFVFVGTSDDTLETMKEKYGDSEVYYALATPIETPLTAEQVEAYKELHTNYPNTTITNDCGAGMMVKYGADTKNHIEQNYVSKETFNSLNNRLSAMERTLLA